MCSRVLRYVVACCGMLQCDAVCRSVVAVLTCVCAYVCVCIRHELLCVVCARTQSVCDVRPE